MLQWPDRNMRESIYNSLLQDAQSSGYFYVMIILSCAVATYGLLSNSTAVVIGAMLIAPLIAPILGGAIAMATNNTDLLKSCLKTEAAGATFAVALSAMLTMVLPHSPITSEVLARTSPTLLDLVIALASGAAGAYAICVKPQSATLPGVAIATALMPPLCSVGVGFAKHDYNVMTGALLLYLANMIAIHAASFTVFSLAGFSNDSYVDNNFHELEAPKKRLRVTYLAIILLVISIPLGYIMYRTYAKAQMDKVVQTALSDAVTMVSNKAQTVTYEYKAHKKVVDLKATIHSPLPMSSENIRQIENVLELKLGKPVSMTADILLAQEVTAQSASDTYSFLKPDTVKVTSQEPQYLTYTPEEVIGTVVAEKLQLLEDAECSNFKFEYNRNESLYRITIYISSPNALPPMLQSSISTILENRLKRKVDCKLILSSPDDPNIVDESAEPTAAKTTEVKKSNMEDGNFSSPNEKQKKSNPVPKKSDSNDSIEDSTSSDS